MELKFDKSIDMTQAQKIRNKINTLCYNEEYSAKIIDDISNQETIKKTLQGSQKIIAKTTSNKFYRLYVVIIMILLNLIQECIALIYFGKLKVKVCKIYRWSLETI